MRPRHAGEACAKCVNFNPPKPAPKGASTDGPGSLIFQYGECRKTALFVKRAPSDGCGDFDKQKG